MDSTTARKTWEMANNIESVSSHDDIYKYDKKQQQDILAAKPWEREWVLFTNSSVGMGQASKGIQGVLLLGIVKSDVVYPVLGSDE